MQPGGGGDGVGFSDVVGVTVVFYGGVGARGLLSAVGVVWGGKAALVAGAVAAGGGGAA